MKTIMLLPILLALGCSSATSAPNYNRECGKGTYDDGVSCCQINCTCDVAGYQKFCVTESSCGKGTYNNGFTCCKNGCGCYPDGSEAFCVGDAGTK